MFIKESDNLLAIQLRKEGLSYSEIIKSVKVSKSTLSLWLRNIPLDENAKSRLRKKLANSQKLGAEARRKQRIVKTIQIEKFAISEVPEIKINETFLMGVMLYWAEGSKQRNGSSQGVEFSNSDPSMCRFFMKWLKTINISQHDIIPCIYIHESKSNLIQEALSYWAQQLGFSKAKFGKTCLTKTVYPRKNKRKDSENYYGQLRIRVRKSTDLNRKVAGWIKGICIQSGVDTQNFV